MNIKLINAFLASEPQSESEQLLRNNTINLNAALTKALSEREELFKSLRAKEEDVLRISGALENQLAIVENLAKSKGLQPLEMSEEQTQQETQELEETEAVTPSPA